MTTIGVITKDSPTRRRLRLTGLACLIASAFAFSPMAQAGAQESSTAKARTLLPFEKSGGKNTSIEEIVLEPGGRLPVQGHLEERLYYVLEGRGMMSTYGSLDDGDAYLIRQDVAL